MFAAIYNAWSRSHGQSEPGTLEIRPWHTSHAVILRVFGEIWSSNVERFTEEVGRLIDPAKPLLVVDLTNVSFVGSQGISALLHLSKQRALSGAELRVVAPASGVRDTFTAAHLQRVLKIHDTVAGALVDCAELRK
jgi:anti-anti-sigma factor